MPKGYGSQKDYIARVSAEAKKRTKVVEQALRNAFSGVIESRPAEYIVFSKLTVLDLTSAIESNPTVLKPLLLLCNVAARAIERDLKIKNLNTYAPRLSKEVSAAIAGYIFPFLPAYATIDSLSILDSTAFIDKEVRKAKGNWEKDILKELNAGSRKPFKKRHFTASGEAFELDAASPADGDVKVAVDVKRVEARRDIHKRCDEIVNKAAKLKSTYPDASFGAVIYYPFPEEHTNVLSRLEDPNIDAIAFAAETKDSIKSAVKMLLAKLGIRR